MSDGSILVVDASVVIKRPARLMEEVASALENAAGAKNCTSRLLGIIPS